jgi:hypothetical protein
MRAISIAKDFFGGVSVRPLSPVLGCRRKTA